MATPQYTPFDGITVTVPLVATQLITLLQAVDPNVSPRCRFVTLQSDPDQVADGTIAVGDASVSVSRMSFKLKKAATAPLTLVGINESDFNITRFWVIGTSATATLNVGLMRG